VLRAFTTHAWPGNVRELENLLKRLAVTAQGAPIGLEQLPWKPSDGTVSDTDAHAAHLMEVVRTSRNMTEAAAVLGVTRSTLYRQLERLHLRPGRMVVRGS
jgi:two-component system NtrC family response regulator